MSPVKFRAQPVNVSFSSSRQTGRDDKGGGRIEEEGREEMEEEDAELKSLSSSPSACTCVKHSTCPASAYLLSSGPFPQAYKSRDSSPNPCLTPVSVPGSGSMTDLAEVDLIGSCGFMACHILTRHSYDDYKYSLDNAQYSKKESSRSLVWSQHFQREIPNVPLSIPDIL